MRTTRAKGLILAGLLAVWALVFVFVLRPPGGDSPPRSERPAAADRTARAAGPGGGIPRLRMDLLNAPRAPYPAEVQEIFSTPPPPPSPIQNARLAGSAAPPPPPPDPFQEEARHFRYVGFLRSDGTATAFIVRGQEVYTIAVGGLLGDRYRVMEVREDSVLLGSPTGDKQVRLSLATEGAAASRAPEIVTVPRVPPGVLPPRGAEPPAPPQVPGAALPPRPERIVGPAPRGGSQ